MVVSVAFVSALAAAGAAVVAFVSAAAAAGFGVAVAAAPDVAAATFASTAAVAAATAAEAAGALCTSAAFRFAGIAVVVTLQQNDTSSSGACPRAERSATYYTQRTIAQTLHCGRTKNIDARCTS